MRFDRELPGANPLQDANAALDTAVLTAYGFTAYGFTAKKDLLAQRLALNQQVAAKIEKNESVTAPGVPKNYPDAKKLVTDDCIWLPHDQSHPLRSRQLPRCRERSGRSIVRARICGDSHGQR